MKTFLKILLGIFILLVVLFVIGSFMSSSNNGAGSNSNPNPNSTSSDNADPQLDVASQNSQIGNMVKITSKNDTTISLQRVVINNRDGQAGCDFSNAMNDKTKAYYSSHGPSLVSPNFPVGGIVMKTGDQILIFVGEECGATVKAVITTDHGTGSYSFDDQ